jgi:WD40-like Beta Propeller Repeat
VQVRARQLFVLAAIAAAGAVLAGEPATASVIVDRCGADFANLCRFDPISRHSRPLTSDGTASMPYQSPSLSRDGRRLAFVFDGQVYVGDANARGRQLVPGTQGAQNVELRPDAAAVSFVASRALPFPPCLSPSCPEIPEGAETALWTSRLNGRGKLRRQNASPGTGSSWLGGRLVAPRVIPSRRLRWQVICLLARGDCARLVAADRSRSIEQPAVSPDGSLLVATVGRALDQRRPAGRLALYSTQTGRRVRFLTDGPRDAQPTWSPDGRFVAFTRYAKDLEPSPAAIYSVPSSGGRARRMVAGKDPTWAR